MSGLDHVVQVQTRNAGPLDDLRRRQGRLQIDQKLVNGLRVERGVVIAMLRQIVGVDVSGPDEHLPHRPGVRSRLEGCRPDGMDAPLSDRRSEENVVGIEGNGVQQEVADGFDGWCVGLVRDLPLEEYVHMPDRSAGAPDAATVAGAGMDAGKEGSEVGRSGADRREARFRGGIRLSGGKRRRSDLPPMVRHGTDDAAEIRRGVEGHRIEPDYRAALAGKTPSKITLER
ncbi:hypothetical protein [Aureimonas sp. Leaf454]|uniref:hypothetical protein n=1 Tax=Aureimonas sp. Leaf454 TaxID=1736381 RepID=UPI001FCCF053|nr:hypothetical protein [Aureimonas sp. Leaf454]